MAILNTISVQNEFKPKLDLSIPTKYNNLLGVDYLIYFDTLYDYKGQFGFDNGKQATNLTNNKIFFNASFENLYKLKNEKYYKAPFLSLKSGVAYNLTLKCEIRPFSNIQTSTKKIELISSLHPIVQIKWKKNNDCEIEEKLLGKYEKIVITIGKETIEKNETIEIIRSSKIIGKINLIFQKEVELCYKFIYVHDDNNSLKITTQKIIKNIQDTKLLIDGCNHNILKQANIKVKEDSEYLKNWNIGLFDYELASKAYTSHELKAVLKSQSKENEKRIIFNLIFNHVNKLYHNNIYIVIWPFVFQNNPDIIGFSFDEQLIDMDNNRYPNNIIVLFDDHRVDSSIISHELGHLLSLEHTFHEDKLETKKGKLTEVLKKWFPDILVDLEAINIKNYEEYCNTVYSLLRKQNKYKEEINPKLIFEPIRFDNHDIIGLYSSVCFKKTFTKNIMDYSTKRSVFYKFQWDIMRSYLINNFKN